MDLDMVLNELSIQSPAPNVQTARCWMLDLILTLRSAVSLGVRRNLRTHIDLNSTSIADGYTFARWRNDSNVDQDTRTYFKTIITKYPPINDLPGLQDDALLHDFYHQNRRAYGLGIAALLEGLAISFPSDPIWNSCEISLKADGLDDDNNLISEMIKVCHASQYSHINRLAPWIKDRLRKGVQIQDGTDLWNQKEAIFPSLIFCEHIERDLKKLPSGSLILRQVVKKLFEIENYCQIWQEGSFNPNSLPFRITGESEVTIQKYPRERTFFCPDGEERIFTWHCRLTPCAWRIYFDPSAEPGRIYIGNIGPKPPSVKYPT